MPKRKISMRASQFTKAFLPVQGQRFHFKHPSTTHNWREYLYPIYDNLYRECVMKTGRQVEKSTTQSNRHIAYSCLIPFFRSVYVSPTAKQTRVFSNDRLKKTIDTSPFIKKYFVDHTTTDQVFEKSFTNRSVIFLGYAYHSADSMRGLSADMMNIDEYQDILSDNIPVLREILFASEYKIFMATGTPKTFDNHLEKLWQDSTQNIWLIPCKSCGIHNRLDQEPEGVISEEGMVCKNCRSKIDPRDGFWYSLFPNRRMAGFHISQLQTGRLLKPDNWTDFYYNKYLKYPKAQLYNEVFGLSYDNADKPITRTMMEHISKGHWMDKLDYNITRRARLYMGVDWGENKGSFNCYVIGGFVENMFTIFHIRKFDRMESSDPDFVLKEICRKVQEFKIEVVACDHGAGHKENLRLQRMLGKEKVWEIYHSGNQKKTFNWDPHKEMYVTNRSKVMEQVIFPIQEGNFRFPAWEYMNQEIADDRKLWEDYTALNKEYSERLRMFKYDHDTPDDLLQSTVYAKFAAHICEQRPFT